MAFSFQELRAAVKRAEDKKQEHAKADQIADKAPQLSRAELLDIRVLIDDPDIAPIPPELSPSFVTRQRQINGITKPLKPLSIADEVAFVKRPIISVGNPRVTWRKRSFGARKFDVELHFCRTPQISHARRANEPSFSNNWAWSVNMIDELRDIKGVALWLTG